MLHGSWVTYRGNESPCSPAGRDLRFAPTNCRVSKKFRISEMLIYRFKYTSIERKSRMPQIQGVQGWSRSKLLRTLGNAGDEVSSAFSESKQNENLKEKLYLTNRRDTRFQVRQKMCFNFSMIQSFFILFTINWGYTLVAWHTSLISL